MAQPPIEIFQATSPDEIEAARNIIKEYIAWAFTIEPDAENAPPFIGIEEELAGLPGIFALPSGRLLLATHLGQVAGCVCLKRLDDETSELKRLYVSPAARGMSIGNLLVAKLIEEAGQCGYKRIVLDSHMSMTHAHAIYRAAGFNPIPPPPDVPENIKEIAIFMECNLAP